jgi:tellurite methyltransferase
MTMKLSTPSQTHWSDFYTAVEHQPPHDTLHKALALFDNEPERLAIDLGCGSGRDTLELLRHGWRVLAIDRESEGIERLRKSVTQHQQSRLQTQVTSFEGLHDLPACDFINASFSLPFCAPTHFAGLWEMIVRAVARQGCFAGTFFGEHDSWAGESSMTFHTCSQLEVLLEPFKIEHLLEEESDGKTALGDTKHWHTFEVVAFKC